MPTTFRATCAALLAVSAVAVFGVTHATAAAAATAHSYTCDSLANYADGSSKFPKSSSSFSALTMTKIPDGGHTVTLASACDFTLMALKIDIAAISTDEVTIDIKKDVTFTAASLTISSGSANTRPITISITGTTFKALSTANVKKTFIKFMGSFPAKSAFTLTGNTFDLKAAGDATAATMNLASLNFGASLAAGLTVSVSGNKFTTVVTSSNSIDTTIHHIAITLIDALDQANLDFNGNTYVLKCDGMTRSGSPATTSIAPIDINTGDYSITNSKINLFGGGDTVAVSIYGATSLSASATLNVAGLATIEGTLTKTNVLVAGPGVDASMFIASSVEFSPPGGSFIGMFGLLADFSGGSLVLATGTDTHPVASRISCETTGCGTRDVSEVFATIAKAVTFADDTKISASYLTHAVLNADKTDNTDATPLLVLKTGAVTLAGNGKTALDFSVVNAIASKTKLTTTTTAMPAMTALATALPPDDKKPALKLWFATTAPTITTAKANLLVCHSQYQGQVVTDQHALIDTAITAKTVAFPACPPAVTQPKGGDTKGGDTKSGDKHKGSGVTASGVHLGLIVGLCVVALVVG